MAGRGGRGEALLKFLEQKQKLLGGGDGAEQKLQEPDPLPTGRGPVVEVLGRGARLIQLLSEKDKVMEREDGEQAVRMVPMGRAALLASFIEKDRTKQTNGLSNTINSIVKPMSKMSTENTESTSKPQEEEKPPVIMKGEKGTRVEVSANYIDIKIDPNQGIFEYLVQFEPDVEARKMRFSLMNDLVYAIGDTRSFDGSVLYLPFKLKEDKYAFDCTHPGDGSDVKVKITYKRKHIMDGHVHFYNVLFRRIMKMLNFVQIQRNHFIPSAAHPFPQHKLEVWPGYATVIEAYEGGLKLCVHSTTRVLRTQTVLQRISEIQRGAGGEWRMAAWNEFIGSSILTRYNNKIYRVDDIEFSKNPLSTFENNEGKMISFKDYYQQRYSLEIRDNRQPLLLSKMKRKDQVVMSVCLIPEFCYLTGLTDDMRNDFRVMKDLGAVSKLDANERQRALKTFINNIRDNEKASKLLNDWGLRIDNTPLRLEGRVADHETIFFGQNKEVPLNADPNWNRQCTSYHMLNVVDLNHWFIVHTQNDSQCVNEFVMKFIEFAGKMGMRVQQPNLIPLPNDRSESYLKALKSNITDHTRLVVVVFRSARDDMYSAVKKLCCVERPVASQVILSKTISSSKNTSKTNSCVQKIALQINCKLGGALWSIKVPFKNAMICGIDTYHDAKGDGKSVGAFVCSLNSALTRWFSLVTIQTKGEELIEGLRTSLYSSLKKYYEINKTYPNTIVIFRDGVGDGQLGHVISFEIEQLKNVMPNISPDYSPELAVIICQKRINTRIYSALRGCQFGNPMPGTILDHSITRRNLYDFFLVSQHVREGTVTPTHYIVAYNSSRLKPDHIQRLTYKMCHLYYNWPGTIRVPAPCQYAHKLAYLVGQNIHKEPSKSLQDKLFYL
uniref:Piwi domain-containing protein n=1 Tax=Clastoptera arizonana TaxID=38151 RepID=A0A1B6BXC6_9HEMI